MNEAKYLIIGIILGVFMCRYIFPIFGKMIIDAAKRLKKQKPLEKQKPPSMKAYYLAKNNRIWILDSSQVCHRICSTFFEDSMVDITMGSMPPNIEYEKITEEKAKELLEKGY